jgi:hypothetical protein
MIIDNHDIAIKQLNPISWEITVKCPSGVTMFGRVRIPQLDEQLAYKIFRQNVKNFAIDAEVISVTVEEVKDEVKEENKAVENTETTT